MMSIRAAAGARALASRTMHMHPARHVPRQLRGAVRPRPELRQTISAATAVRGLCSTSSVLRPFSHYRGTVAAGAWGRHQTPATPGAPHFCRRFASKANSYADQNLYQLLDIPPPHPPTPSNNPDVFDKYFGAAGGGAASGAAKNLKRAYFQRAKTCHPDIVGTDNPDSKGEFQALTEAYQVLSDPVRRRSYDAQLLAASGSGFAGTTGGGSYRAHEARAKRAGNAGAGPGGSGFGGFGNSQHQHPDPSQGGNNQQFWDVFQELGVEDYLHSLNQDIDETYAEVSRAQESAKEQGQSLFYTHAVAPLPALYSFFLKRRGLVAAALLPGIGVLLFPGLFLKLALRLGSFVGVLGTGLLHAFLRVHPAVRRAALQWLYRQFVTFYRRRGAGAGEEAVCELEDFHRACEGQGGKRRGQGGFACAAGCHSRRDCARG